MYECPTCGIILERTSTIRARRDGNHRHKTKCESAKPEERRYFKRMGHWPSKGVNLAKYRD